MREFKIWSPCVSATPGFWEEMTARIQRQRSTENSPHHSSSCFEHNGSTFVQRQHPWFSCTLPCHLSAAWAEPLCYGMDPSSSQLVPSGLDGNAAWLETFSEKNQKPKESGWLWNDPVSFRLPEYANYCHLMPGMKTVGCVKREN